MKQHNPSIDILKFFAAILITNSHMEILYHPEYVKLATGGAIGDVLFFFCSGFTLFLGRMDRFDNWYKRRINRIYPTVFAWALVGAVFFNLHYDAVYQWIHGGGWFVTCIMIYYVVLYFIRKYMMNRLVLAFMLSSLIILIWYFFEDSSVRFMYGNTYFKWGHYFLFMLLGAAIGISQKQWKFNFKWDFIKLIGSIVIYYALMIASDKSDIMAHLQIISLIPLLSITFYFYKVSNSEVLLKLYNTKVFGWIMGCISTLTLEIYVVQYSLFTDKMNSIFPLNLFIMFVFIALVAYGVKVLSRIFSQTFSESPYNWRVIFKI